MEEVLENQIGFRNAHPSNKDHYPAQTKLWTLAQRPTPSFTTPGPRSSNTMQAHVAYARRTYMHMQRKHIPFPRPISIRFSHNMILFSPNRLPYLFTLRIRSGALMRGCVCVKTHVEGQRKGKGDHLVLATMTRRRSAMLWHAVTRRGWMVTTTAWLQGITRIERFTGAGGVVIWM